MKNLNYQTGKIGEQIGREYLIQKGYQIIESNFRTRFGEIDLIATKDNRLIFGEIKLKIGENSGSPEEMITSTKLRKIRQMAECFLQIHPQIANKYSLWQIDAICIVLNNDQTIKRINHWENLSYEME